MWTVSGCINELHPLPCKGNTNCCPCHSALYGIVYYVLDVAGFSSILEPVGLDRGNTNTLVDSYFLCLSHGLGRHRHQLNRDLASDESCQHLKQNNVENQSIFTPISAETFGHAVLKSFSWLTTLEVVSRRPTHQKEVSWLSEPLTLTH